MFGRLIGLGVVIAFSFAHAQAEDRACPAGSVGAWTWTATGLGITVQNPGLEFEWATIGQPIAGKGLKLSMNVDYETGIPMLASYETSAPTLLVNPGGDDGGQLLFGSFQVDAVYPPYPRGHQYALYLVDGMTGQALSAPRIEFWEIDDKKGLIDAVWVSDGVSETGLDLLARESLILLARLMHFGAADGMQSSNVARSSPIDLSEARQAWAAALTARTAESAVSRQSGQSCKRP